MSFSSAPGTKDNGSYISSSNPKLKNDLIPQDVKFSSNSHSHSNSNSHHSKQKSAELSKNILPNFPTVDFTSYPSITGAQHNKPLHQDSLDKSVSSLKNIDLNSLINSIHFDAGIENNYFNSSQIIQNNNQTHIPTGDPVYRSPNQNVNKEDMLLSMDFLENLPSKGRAGTQISSNVPNMARSIDFLSSFQKNTTTTDNLINKKSFDFNLNLNMLNNQVEDKFDLNLIKRQVRGVIIV
jgi:hypothetical protein